jgi:mRNA interferase HigB
VHLIAAKTIRRFADRHKDARTALLAWLRLVEDSSWRSIDDVRRAFPHADAVKVKSGRDVSVFNIRGNTYRLITAIHFNRGKVYVLRFMRHAEYTKDFWKDQL